MLLGFLCVQVVDVRDYLTLMDDKGILRHDLPAPDGDVGKAIRDKVASSNEDTVEVCIIYVQPFPHLQVSFLP